MRAELEVKEIQYRGVSLTSETEEEKQVLNNIWNQKGQPAAWARLSNGQIQLVIAPTPDTHGK